VRPALFTALLAAAGLCVLILTPPFQVPDSGSHFFRAFELSRGQIISEKRGPVTGGVLPRAVQEERGRYGDLPRHGETKLTVGDFRQRLTASPALTEAELRRTEFVTHQYSLFSPVVYLPQSLAIALSVRLHLRDIAAFYLASLFGLCFCLCCWWASLRALDFSPRYQGMVFAVASLPATLFLSASVSADGVTISLCILSVALALRLRQSFSQRGFLAFLAVTALVSLCKTIYFTVPLAVLPLALGAPPRRRARAVQVLVAAVLPMLLWSALTRDTFSVWNVSIHVDPAAQLRFVLAHPLLVSEKFAVTLFESRRFTSVSLVGLLGWLDAPLPPGYVTLAYLLLFAASLLGSADDARHVGARAAAWMLALFLAFVLLLCLSQYLTWNAVGGDFTVMQGRYLLPFVLVLMLLPPRLVTLPPRALVPLLLLAAGVLWWGTVQTLARRYWIL
jgi:uncharacterized membrane protein